MTLSIVWAPPMNVTVNLTPNVSYQTQVTVIYWLYSYKSLASPCTFHFHPALMHTTTPITHQHLLFSSSTTTFTNGGKVAASAATLKCWLAHNPQMLAGSRPGILWRVPDSTMVIHRSTVICGLAEKPSNKTSTHYLTPLHHRILLLKTALGFNTYLRLYTGLSSPTRQHIHFGLITNRQYQSQRLYLQVLKHIGWKYLDILLRELSNMSSYRIRCLIYY